VKDQLEMICMYEIVTYIKILSQDLPGRTKETTKTLSVQTISRLIFEHRTSRTQTLNSDDR